MFSKSFEDYRIFISQRMENSQDW